ncbi:MAG: hypothetical protein ACETVQ_02290 [Candidatus Bathyarchaeia archaeon]
MLICPNCRNKIPARKLLRLTYFNPITCPTCSTRLRIKNKTVSRLIGGILGGIGGGIGGLLAIRWVRTKEMFYIMLMVALLALIFLASWLASIKFVKLAKQDIGRQT